MPRRVKIEYIISKYFQNNEMDKLDALYMWARHMEPYFSEQLGLKYGIRSKLALEEVMNDFKEMGIESESEFGIRHVKMEDTGEEIREVVKKEFEAKCISIFKKQTEEKTRNLSLEGKRFAYLLYKDRQVLSLDKLGGEYIEGIPVIYRICFGESPKKGIMHYSGEDDLIAAGLLEYESWSSRRNFHQSWLIPVYAKDIWNSLPNLVDFSEIKEQISKNLL